MAIKKAVKLTATDLLSDPALALAMAGASVSGLRAQGAQLTKMSKELDALIKEAQTLHVEVSGSAASLDERAQLRKKVIADARKLKLQLKQAQARYNKAKLQFLALCAAAGIELSPKKKKVTKVIAKKGKFAGTIGALPADLAPKPVVKKRHAKVVDPFEHALNEALRLSEKQAKLAPVAVVSVAPVSVSLFGKDVPLAEMEKHVEALLQARAAEVQSAVDAQLTVHKDAEAELRKQLAQANAQLTSKNTELTSLKAQIAAATAEHDTLQQQLASAEGLRENYAGALGEVILYVDKRFNADVERIRRTYHLK